MIGNLRVGLVLLLAVVSLLILLPVHLVALLFSSFGWTAVAGLIPVVFHRILIVLFGARLRIKGAFSKHRPLLIVANHVSWFDIVVLGATRPLSFVAKSDMESWPVFGTLAKLQRTVFIKREQRRNSGQQASDIAMRMAAREIMVLFPEGTTSDGNMLLPFKTTLFEAAKLAVKNSEVDSATVQPIALNYARLNGMPIGRSERPHVAWPGEVGLGESLLGIIKEGALDIEVLVGEPIILTEKSNRKIVAAEATETIKQLLAGH